MNEIEVTCHPMPEWSGCFRIHVSSNGKLLAIGRDPGKAAAARLIEEGLAHNGTRILIKFTNGRFGESILVDDALAGNEPAWHLDAGDQAGIAALEAKLADFESQAIEVQNEPHRRSYVRLTAPEVRAVVA